MILVHTAILIVIKMIVMMKIVNVTVMLMADMMLMMIKMMIDAYPDDDKEDDNANNIKTHLHSSGFEIVARHSQVKMNFQMPFFGRPMPENIFSFENIRLQNELFSL